MGQIKKQIAHGTGDLVLGKYFKNVVKSGSFDNGNFVSGLIKHETSD